jgi:Ca2+-binding EF-hand superfamily protein
MKKRKLNHNKNNRKHIEFATNLFISFDDDGSGIIEADEIIKPLIALGLSTNSNFTIKLMQALVPENASKNEEDLQLTLKDFVRIFKSDRLSERVTELIKEEFKAQFNASSIKSQKSSKDIGSMIDYSRRKSGIL